MNRVYKNYLLVFFLLFFSGNPLATHLWGNMTPFVFLILTIGLLQNELFKLNSFYKYFFILCLGLLIIFILQWAILGYVSWLGAANVYAKIFTGGIIIYYLSNEFPYYFFNTLFYLSILSLFFFIIISILNIPLPKIEISNMKNSYLFYYESQHSIVYKNQGMFWEPGAHAGILTLCLALIFDKFNYYWDQYKFKFLIVIIALLSTKSTTGFIVFFIILIFNFVNFKNIFGLIILLPIILGIGWHIYNTADFMKVKIDKHYENTYDQEIGEFSNTRFGALIFDWHYVQKHPFIGNGLHEKTRYVDHHHLLAEHSNLGMPNGFSHYLASMGIFFIIGYFLLFYNALNNHPLIYKVLLIIVVFLNLQGEQWFNYPIYLGLPFLFLKYNKESKLKLKIDELISDFSLSLDNSKSII